MVGDGGSLSLAGFAYSPRFQMSIGDFHHHRGCPRVVVLTPAQTSIDAYTLSVTRSWNGGCESFLRRSTRPAGGQ
eukprot:5458728-Pyramimonas_sp.AAC.1